LHWLIALLVFGLLAIGLLLGNVGYDGLVESVGGEVTGMLYKYHKTFGIILLGLMVVRVILKRTLGSPKYDPPMHGVQHLAAVSVHVLLYVSLIAMSIAGWLATATGGFPVQFFDIDLPGLIGKNAELYPIFKQAHAWIGWFILGLIVVHVAAGLYHWKVKKDGIMERISLP
jgi:cytochrome b561